MVLLFFCPIPMQLLALAIGEESHRFIY